MQQSNYTPSRLFSTMSRRQGLAFTLIELVVVMVVLAILAGLATFIFSSVRRSSADLAGKPVLGVAQAEGRKVAATNGYVYPANTVARLDERATVVKTESGQSKIGFIGGASYAPGSAKNTADAYLVSTATDTNGGTRIAYAVETTRDGDGGHCWGMIDTTSETGDISTTWGFSEQVASGQCAARVLLACPTMADGSADQPSLMGTMESCGTPENNVDVAAPSCVIAEIDVESVPAASRPTTAVVQWETPDNTDNISGYRVYVWEGQIGNTQADLTRTVRTVDVTGATTNTAQVPNLVNGKQYTFTVASMSNGIVVTKPEAILKSQTTFPLVQVRPDVVGSLAASATSNSATVTWTAQEGAETFLIYREMRTSASPVTYGPKTKIAQMDVRLPTQETPNPSTSYSYTDDAVSSGTNYRYTVETKPFTAQQEICGQIIRSGDNVVATSTLVDVSINPPALEAAVIDFNQEDADFFADDVFLTWETVPGATGYDLYWEGNTSSPLLSNTTSTEYVHEQPAHNRLRGSRIRYWVVARKDAAVSTSREAYAYIGLDTPTLSATPTTAQADGRRNDVALTWTMPTTPGSTVASFTLQRCVLAPRSNPETADCTNFQTVSGANALSGSTRTYTDSNLTAGSTVSYRIVANPTYVPNQTPTTSEEARATLPMVAPVLTSAKPTATTGRLTWTPSYDVDEYMIYESVNGGAFTEVAAVGPATTTWDRPTALSNGSYYVYYVEAFNSYTEVPSNEATIYTTLAAPRLNVVATAAQTDGVINDPYVSWSPVESATNYDVIRVNETTPGVALTTLANATTVTNYTHANQALGSRYCYQARSRNAGGVSGWSNVACVDLNLATPVISVTNNNGTLSAGVGSSATPTTTVSWPIVSGATSYSVTSNVYNGTPRTVNLSATGATNFVCASGRCTYTVTDANAPNHVIWGQKVTFTVQAVANQTRSANSNQGISDIVPAAPDFRVDRYQCNSNCRAGVFWSWKTGADTVQIMSSRNAGSGFSVVGTTRDRGVKSYVYNPGSGVTQFYYARHVKDSVGPGPRSATDGVTIAPTAPRITASTNGLNVTVSFAAVPGANGYYLYRNGANAIHSTSNSITFRGAPSETYTLVVYPYATDRTVPDGGRILGDNSNLIRVSLSANGANPVGTHVNGSVDSYYGQYVVLNAFAFCIDLAAPGPSNTTYRTASFNGQRKATGWPNPRIPANGPVISPVEIEELSYILTRYGITGSSTWSAAAEHAIRIRTVGDSSQRNRENQRWSDLVRQTGGAVVAPFNQINSEAEWYSGPYTITVTPQGSGNVIAGVARNFTISVQSRKGAMVPNFRMMVVTSHDYMPAMISTNANGQYTMRITPDCPGMLGFDIYPTELPPTYTRLSYYAPAGAAQRMMIPGAVDLMGTLREFRVYSS